MKDLKIGIKIGVLGCCYNSMDHLEAGVLKPWEKALAEGTISQIEIVSARFEGFDSPEEDNTRYYLSKNLPLSIGLSVPEGVFSEAAARNLALAKLRDNDYVFLWDSDEYYTDGDIKNIAEFVRMASSAYWYSIPFKNHIFTGKEYVKGFCPPRIFKVETPAYRLGEFYWDNDVFYVDKMMSEKLYYKYLSSIEIPENVVGGGVRHMTWLHDKGKEKVAYHNKHFGHCSYKWNEETQKLEFDEKYYERTGERMPIVYAD